MARYLYTSTSKTGESQQGTIEASSLDTARWALLERGLKPEQLQPAAESDAVEPKSDFVELLDPRSWRSAKSIHIELTLRQLAVMLRSGLTLLAAIETVIEMPSSQAVKKIFVRIRDRLEGGSAITEALSEHPVFPKSVVAMIGLGEESGNLDLVMRRAAEAMENVRRNRNAILTALFYPCFTLLLAIGISVYMVVAVIPPMKQALETMGRPLPDMTQSLLDVSDFVSRFGPAIAIGVLSLGVAFAAVCMWPPGRLFVDRNILRVPLIGTILRNGGTALFARSLGTLLESGIRLVEGLRILTAMHGNRYFAAVVDSARNRILEGGTLADSLNRGKAYTPMMIRMVGVGESSGNLEETLENVADFHEERLAALIKQLSSMIEPAIVLIVGGLVGYIYIAFFVGIYGGM